MLGKSLSGMALLTALLLIPGVALPGAELASARAPAGTAVWEFPADTNKSTGWYVYNNVRELGAKGDGVTDDTEAFRKAIDSAHKEDGKDWCIIWVPDGTYLVTDTLKWGHRTYLIGQRQAATIIKLKDACPGYDKPSAPKPVIRCVYNNNMSFHNYIYNLTVDTGKGNPGAIGVRYNTHNAGILGEVTIRSGDGSGVIGLDMSETEFGPGMVRNLLVEGFDAGIVTPGNCSNAAMANITVRKQRVVGMRNHFPLSLKGFTSVNTVPALINAGALANLVLIDADCSGGAADQPAIENRDGGVAYLRNITAKGYATVLKDNGSALPGSHIDDLFIGQVYTAMPSHKRHLNLPVEDPPEVFCEPMAKWAVVSSEGKDHTKAIQDAIDSGATTIYLKALTNYYISDTIHVRGKVRRIFGMGTSIGGSKEVFVDQKKPMLRFDGTGTEPVILQNVGCGIWPHTPVGVEIATDQTVGLYCAEVGTLVVAPTAKAKIFIEESFTDMAVNGPAKLFIRQLNLENNPYSVAKHGRIYLTANNGDLWVLGYKTEAPAIHGVISGTGRMEVLGGFFRDHFGAQESGGDIPFFRVQDQGAVSATYFSYAWGPGKARALQVEEIRNGVTKDVRVPPNNFSPALVVAWPIKPTEVSVESFTADPLLVEAGQPVTLSWKAPNATGGEILPEVGKVAGSGTITVRPTKGSVTYRLRADGPGGPEMGAVEVLVYRNPDGPAKAEPGLSWSLYEGTWDQLPDFTKLTPAKTGVATAMDFTMGVPDKNFALVFTGFIAVAKTGMYSFFTSSDDGSTLWIGDQKVVDNDGLHGMDEKPGRIALKAGLHAFSLKFMQGGGGKGLEARWEGPDLPKQVIPAAVFSHR